MTILPEYHSTLKPPFSATLARMALRLSSGAMPGTSFHES
jgi:hypothetical protein